MTNSLIGDRHEFLDSVLRFQQGALQIVSRADRAVVYVQISKAGSPSFARYLSDHFRDHDTPTPLLAHSLGEPAPSARAARLIRGQFSFDEWKRWRKDAWLMTFLRDPLRRVIAQYFAHRHPTPSQRLSAAMTPESRRILRFAQRATLEEYILSEDPVVVSQLRDVQTRALSGHSDPEHPDFVSSAIKHLEAEFLFFGVAELYETSIELFRAQTGSTRPYCSTAHRRFRCPEEDLPLSDRASARLKELVMHDRMLYQRAIEIFQARYRAVLQLQRRPVAYSDVPAA